MKENKQIKHDNVKAHLDKHGLFYTEYPNGQLQVDGVNLWTSTENWHDAHVGVKGNGVNSFISHINRRRGL